mgnify:CR=1 FL=1
MATTYDPIATTTLGSAASSITFSSIPSTYTDLRLVLIGGTSSTADVKLQFNLDTATNYSYTTLVGDGTTAYSQSFTNAAYINCDDYWGIPANGQAMLALDVFSYAGSTYKTTLVTIAADKNGSGTSERRVGLWRSTSAITTIKFTPTAGNFTTGTTATLYGIKAA